MKLKVLSFLAFAIIILSSCKNNDTLTMTDDELIQAIQSASDKEDINTSELPTDVSTLLVHDFTESYVEVAHFAPNLGYEVRMRRGHGSRIGEHTDVYFNRDGRELRRDREHDRLRGRDREECFRLAFPVTIILPDGTEISGGPDEIYAAVRAWYADHPNADQRPVLQFPVEIEYGDGTVVTINNQEELNAAYEDCRDRLAHDFECPDMRADIGDRCYRDDRTVGAVSPDCECE